KDDLHPLAAAPADVGIAQIAADELDLVRDGEKIRFVSRAEIVHDADLTAQVHEPGDNVRPDESCSTCDEAPRTSCEHRSSELKVRRYALASSVPTVPLRRARVNALDARHMSPRRA